MRLRDHRREDGTACGLLFDNPRPDREIRLDVVFQVDSELWMSASW